MKIFKKIFRFIIGYEAAKPKCKCNKVDTVEIAVETNDKPVFKYKITIEKVVETEFYSTFIFKGKRLVNTPNEAKWLARIIMDTDGQSIFLDNSDSKDEFCGVMWRDEIFALSSLGGYGERAYKYFLLFFKEKPTKKDVLKVMSKRIKTDYKKS